jgi:PAS domain S-box-containing protein
MGMQKTKDQLEQELEQAQRRIAELERERSLPSAGNQQGGNPCHIFIEQSHEGIFVFDEHGVIIIWNHAQEKLTGISKEKAIGSPYWKIQFQLLPPEVGSRKSPDYLKAAMQNAFKTGEHSTLKKSMEVEIQSLDGQRKFVLISSFPIKMEDSYYIGSITYDVTDRKKAEVALRESESRFSIIYQNSPLGIVITRLSDNVLLDVNNAWLDLLEYTREEVLGKTALELGIWVNPQDRQTMLSILRTRDEKPNIEGILRKKSGETLHALISAETATLNSEECMLTQFIDITKRKQTEEDLRTSREQMGRVLTAAHMGIWRQDLSTSVMEMSPEFARVFGEDTSSVSFDTVRKQIHPEDWAWVNQAIREAIVQRKASTNLQYRLFDINGNMLWVNNYYYVNCDAEGKPVSITGLIQDITNSKVAEEALYRAEMRYRGLIEHAPDGIALVGADGKFKYISPSVERIFGYHPTKDLELTPNELTHPEDLSLVLATLADLTQHPEKVPTLQYRLLHKNGEWRWIESTLSNMLNVPNVEAIVINFHDITRQKQVQLEVRQRQEDLELISKLNDAANQGEDLKTLIDILNEEVKRVYFAMSCTIYLTSPDGKSLITQSTAIPRSIEEKIEKFIGQPIPKTQINIREGGYFQMVLAHKDGIIVNDPDLIRQQIMEFTDSPSISPTLRKLTKSFVPQVQKMLNINSTLTIPLTSNSNVIGLLELSNSKPFTEDVLQRIRGISRQVTVSLLRRQAEEELRTSREKYRGLLESLDSAIATVNEQGNFLYMNDKAAEQLGGTPEQFIGRNMNELFPEPIAANQMQNIQQVIREDNHLVIENLSSIKGTPHWYRTTIEPLHDESGRVIQVLVNSTDIHELKTAQQELMELNRTLEKRIAQRTAEVRDLYDNAPAGYHSLDKDGKIVMINQTEINWLGYTREELIGHRMTEFLSPASVIAFHENHPLFKQVGVLRDLELELVRKDGSLMPVLINATAIYDEDRNFMMSRSTLIDNTSQKAVEEAMRHANLELARAMRMKDEFLASMSHELRTPLTGILGLSEALQMNVYGSLTEKQKSTLTTIETSGRHLLDLINDILDVSKIEAGKLELQMNSCSLGEICQSSIQLTKGMAAKKNQTINFTMTPAIVDVQGDARRLKQVIVNLLSNAVKFTPEGGQIGLEVTASEKNQNVHISIWDKGIGISEEDLKRLFKPFVQLDSSLARQQNGTGLGLALVQRLVEMHGGSINVESAPGRGSRFTVVLPCLPTDSSRISDEIPQKQNFHHALIIEDNRTDAEHLSRYTRSLNIMSTIHNGGKDAVEFAISTQPDVIFLDIGLPDISGWEVLSQLKSSRNTQHIPVIITSVDDDKQKAASLNADGYLVKFFTLTDLRTALENTQKPMKTETPSIPAISSDNSIATIMIVEDNEINIDTLSDVLTAQNFHVVPVKSGVDFLAQVSQVIPDLVLMDIQMPGMDGLETTRRLRAMPDHRLSSVPVIALTALAMPGDREQCINAGADEYVSKPFHLVELQNLILKMLHERKQNTNN